ncbi:MAG: hypothetical protein N2322_07225 [Terrimicrobiaceae bacterium]|nr:hypothetical protein [Terrimicrobiaceae bacterium]
MRLPADSRNPTEPQCAGSRCWRRRAALLACLAAAGLAAVWAALYSSHPLSIKPAEAARIEAQMWRDYYEGRWWRLAFGSFEMARRQFGFSAMDALRLGWHAARAARKFRHDTHSPESVAELVGYYRVVSGRAPNLRDPARAAELEVKWWRQRREAASPEVYAWTIAELAAAVHGGNASSFYPASLARARAMAWRDARRHGGMGDEEWGEVARQLEEAWRLFRVALARPAS